MNLSKFIDHYKEWTLKYANLKKTYYKKLLQIIVTNCYKCMKQPHWKAWGKKMLIQVTLEMNRVSKAEEKNELNLSIVF